MTASGTGRGSVSDSDTAVVALEFATVICDLMFNHQNTLSLHWPIYSILNSLYFEGMDEMLHVPTQLLLTSSEVLWCS